MPTSDKILAELKTLHPRLIDLSLGRIEALLAKLGNPERRLPPVIHVAGTNGKGSVVAFLKAMLEAADKRVHVYTSPHLVRFHERIAIAGADGKARPLGEDELVERLRQTQRINAGDPITQFEITTAAALQAFADHPADALILEVGLGGRLDATNVVARPALSVITPVAMDHTDKLGDTLAKIAWEKAGILKPGVTAVISVQPAEALEAISAHAKSVATPLFVWGSDYEAFEQRGRLVYQSAERLMDLPLPALTEVRWPARMQHLSNGPLARLLLPGSELWLDGGHNPAGGQAIAQTLADMEERSPKPVALVLGMMANKDAPRFLAHFAGLVRRIATVPISDAPEAGHDPAKLAAVAQWAGFPALPASDVQGAIRQLQENEGGPLRILICGSLYLAGQVLALQEGVQAQAN
jgi:dihydrofolate synthase/folylpolyglutamate synthase